MCMTKRQVAMISALTIYLLSGSLIISGCIFHRKISILYWTMYQLIFKIHTLHLINWLIQNIRAYVYEKETGSVASISALTYHISPLWEFDNMWLHFALQSQHFSFDNISACFHEPYLSVHTCMKKRQVASICALTYHISPLWEFDNIWLHFSLKISTLYLSNVHKLCLIFFQLAQILYFCRSEFLSPTDDFSVSKFATAALRSSSLFF